MRTICKKIELFILNLKFVCLLPKVASRKFVSERKSKVLILKDMNKYNRLFMKS